MSAHATNIEATGVTLHATFTHRGAVAYAARVHGHNYSSLCHAVSAGKGYDLYVVYVCHVLAI